MKMCIIEKNQKTTVKNFKLISSGTIETNCSRHNSMTKLCCELLKNENKREMG